MGKPGRRSGGEERVKVEEYEKKTRVLGGSEIQLEWYKIGDTFHCHVLNKEPGATIARAQGATRDEAERSALEKAAARLSVRLL